jgi:pimeloyl-ACP methyl ester carboxylesterase
VSHLAERVLFLPGASGDPAFWSQVAARVPKPSEKILLCWPGFGRNPPSPQVTGLDDLLGLVLGHMDRPVDIVAQSMGGIIAVRAALERPTLIRHLVLVATSGGIDLSRFSVENWREDYRQEFPDTLPGFVDDHTDLAGRLHDIRIPTLLIWGDRDPISPLSVGQYLVGQLPKARLIVIAGGDHMLARDRPAEVAPHIVKHLETED